MTDNRLPPSQLAVVQEFLNSRDVATGRDELEKPDDARRWLIRHRLVAPQTELDDAERRHLAEVRDALVALVAANAGHGDGNGNGIPRRPVTILNEAARRVRLGVRLHPEDGYRLMAEGMGIDRPVGETGHRQSGGAQARVANPEAAHRGEQETRHRKASSMSDVAHGVHALALVTNDR